MKIKDLDIMITLEKCYPCAFLCTSLCPVFIHFWLKNKMYPGIIIKSTMTLTLSWEPT